MSERKKANSPQQKSDKKIKEKNRFSLAILTTYLSAIRTLFTTLLILILITTFFVFLYMVLNKDVVIIEPFEVPKSLSENGYKGRVIVNKLMDQLNHIRITASSEVEDRQFSAAWLEESSDFELPGAGVSIKAVLVEDRQFSAAWLEESSDFELPGAGVSMNAILGIMRELFRRQPTRVTGEVVVLKRDSLQVTIRIIAHREQKTSGILRDLDSLLLESAKYIYKLTQPYILAVFHSRIDEPNSC